MSADHAAATALHEEATRERDQALRDVIKTRQELAALRRTQAEQQPHYVSSTAAEERVRELEDALRQSLLQQRETSRADAALRSDLEASL